MSEPVKKPNQTNPESYSPKTPTFLNMMEEANQGAVQQMIIIPMSCAYTTEL